jgi:3-oxoacid CoA-transferase B subunit
MISPQEDTIVRRAAAELQPGMVVNLGIGLPTLVPSVLPKGFPVLLHSENGFVGMGPADAKHGRDHWLIDAGGRACTLLPGGAFFDSLMSFALVRGGRLDVAMLGAFEVSMAGDLANWMIPGKLTPGMGGGMELAQKARRVIVLSRHLDKNGRGKLVEQCSLPLTGRACVDTLITERAVFRRVEGRMMLASIHPEHDRKSALEGIDCEIPARPGTLEPWQA